jgi:hypothetical protein
MLRPLFYSLAFGTRLSEAFTGTNSAVAFVSSTTGSYQIKTPQRIQSRTVLHYADPQDTIAPDLINTATDHRSTSHKSTRTRSKFDIAWHDRFTELKQYYDQHGHSDLPYSHADKKLSRWVTNQRQLKKQGKASMAEERVGLLDSVDFTWNPRSTWENRFSELQAFYESHGHCNVPLNEEEHLHLGRFVAAQRHQYKLRIVNGKGSLTDDRLSALESINFQFVLSTSIDIYESDTNWNNMYSKFKSFYYEHNHSTLSAGHPLWKWAETQRVAYKKWQQKKDSFMTEERIQQMNALKFVWNSDEAQWINNYEELQNFEMHNGHVDVASNDNGQLHSWLQAQLEENLNGSLDSVKYNALERVGVTFRKVQEVQSSDSLWDEQFEELKAYANENGDCLVPQHYDANPRLGYFVKNQRRQYKLLEEEKKSSLTEEREDKLDSIGFAWSKTDTPRSQKIELIELSIRQALKRSYEKKIAAKHQKMAEDDAEALMASYKRNSLWGI